MNTETDPDAPRAKRGTRPKAPDAAERIYDATQAAKRAMAVGTPFTRDDAIAAIRAQLVVEGFVKKRVNGRDLHFDALAEACGYVGPVTKAAAGQIAAALKGIREVEPAVTPEELRRVATRVRERYDKPTGPKAGPMAVCVHWHEFAVNQERRTAAARKDPYVEPPGWRDTLKRLAQERGWEVNHLDGEWLQLSLTLRQEILKASG